MHDVALLATLAGGLTAALALGYLTERLHLSPIVGYLLAGLLVGPYTPGFVADAHLHRADEPGAPQQLGVESTGGYRAAAVAGRCLAGVFFFSPSAIASTSSMLFTK